ncbi:MAG TPA: hypothetical protein VGF17_04930 [Phytomonospora sp.]
MADGDLLQPADIAGYPNVAAAAADVVTGVGDAIRAYCGWHIAPSRAETLRTRGTGTGELYLSTMKLTDVTAIRDVTFPGAPVEVTGFRFQDDGVIYGATVFPRGRRYEVDVVHGYDQMPPEIASTAAALVAGSLGKTTVRQKTLGPGSVTYETASAPASPLDRYTLVAI